ncbi:MAG: ABC transporter ATP-binding protein [Planctomycetota bacterium]
MTPPAATPASGRPPAPGSPPPSAIDLRRVGKVYPGGTRALDGVTCRFEPGEFVSLLGPSGCGKCTVLRIVAGLAAPTTGEVVRGGKAGGGSPGVPMPTELGCVFQEPTLMPWARVWDNVYLPLRLRGVRRRAAQDRVDAALTRVGLADFAGALPRELSGGMKMRVAVARATVARPAVLMLDEPFAALDEITRFRLNDDLLRLWSEQAWTGLFVTHSVFESVYLSSRVIVMSGRPGRVIEEVAVPLPYPRDDATRTSAEYVSLCRHVSDALRRSMAGAGQHGAADAQGGTRDA